MIKLILFDLDGVLIDSKENMKISWNAVRRQFNLAQTFTKYFRNIGLPFCEILKRIAVNKNQKNIEASYNKNSIDNFNKISLFPHVRSTLNYLRKKKYKLGVVTSKNQQRTKKILKKFKLNSFDIVVAPKKNLRGKPYPDQILYALKKLKMNNKETYYVGDMNFDHSSAKNAKVKFIFAKYGYGQFKKTYYLSINNINELKEIIL